MAAADILNSAESVAAGAYMTIQPGAGVEWLIQVITHNDDVEITQYDGTYEPWIDSDAGQGSWAKHAWGLTNTSYMRVKNTSASPQHMGYMGVVTK